MIGLSFPIARQRIVTEITSFLDHVDSTTHTINTTDNTRLLLLISTIIAIILLVIIAIVTNDLFSTGLIVTIVVSAVVLVLCMVTLLGNKHDKYQEICNEIKDIVSTYKTDLDQYSSDGDDDSNDQSIASGHSQVSIVTTCRLGKWRRIPLLLLAEGDIIALSAGDLAPGDVIELIPSSSSSSPAPSSAGSSSSSYPGYELGNSIKKGTKILLRQHTTSTQGLSMGIVYYYYHHHHHYHHHH
jgi:hypothetical protein